MSTFTPSEPCEPAQPISLSKCPVFPTNSIFTVEPDPIVHNPPSRRLNNRRHQQWNFIIEHFQIQVPARAHHRLVTEATGRRPAKHHDGVPTEDPLFTFT